MLEDLGHLESADHLEGLSLPRTERVINEIAALHAWSMRDGAAAVDSLSLPGADDPVLHALSGVAFSVGWATYLRQARQPVPAAVTDFVARGAALVPGILVALAEPRAMVHGDLRVDNLFFDSEDRPHIVDFQLGRRGSGVCDLAYLVSQGLRTEDRRGQDERLLERYRTSLGERGAEPLDAAASWRQYRLAVMLQIMYPLAALMGWDGLPERARDLCLTLIERAIATAEDVDAYAALDGLT